MISTIFPPKAAIESDRAEFFAAAEKAGLSPTPEDAWKRAALFFSQVKARIKDPAKYPAPAVGLFFYGPCGAGKTELALFLRDRIRAFGIRVPIVRTVRLIEEYRRNELSEDTADGMPRDVIVLDDVGYENNGKKYGDTWGVADFLKSRYECAFNRNHNFTIATTNLNGINEIELRYGQQIASRCLEMFDFVLLSHTDRRGETAKRRAYEIQKILEG